ncbi:GNAT family N-acetyltransferase [Candidatus Shapirobacteria bacterium]|nr:GNAT family N-acetyltransferase [Candidatus Shapirobacteria bacterium]
MKVKIRRSSPDDVYGIREVQRETWLATYPDSEEGITVEEIKAKFNIDSTPEGKKKMEERKKRYGDRNAGIWVAENEDEIIGFCMARREGENNRVGAIYVLPCYQGRGFGRLLIERAFDWLGNKKNILVNVARYNQKAIDFYKKFGFVETGKSGTFDDAAKLPSGKFIPEIELVKASSVK